MPQEIDRLNAAFTGAYAIVRELAGGGMARVFLADDLRLQRRVVIKMLSPDRAGELSAERFEREIALVAALQQANIVPVLTSGEVDGAAWYAMPYIDGESLRVRMNGAPIGTPEAVGLLRDVARALAYAHAHGIIHRDIKPDNILLSGGTAVVTDFGIAKAVDAARTRPDDSLTLTGMSLGTPAYMAPEQAAGDPVDSRADLYAWGVVAYEMLSGAHPFAGRTTAQALIAAHLVDEPEPLVGVAATAPALAALVLACMAKNAGERPANAAELVTILDTITTGATPVPSRSRRALEPIAFIACVAVIVGIVAAMVAAVVWPRGKPTQPIPAISQSTAPSLVVLPFDNMSTAADGEVFADGITEDVIARLATIGGLSVISRTSAMVYKKHDKSLKQIAAELNVASVLEGSVRRIGSQVRVVAQLIDAATGRRLWGQTFDRELADVFALQSELAERIAGSLKATLSPATKQNLAAQPALDTLAYQMYLRGLAAYNERTTDGFRRAIPLAEAAVRRDSTFARAWQLLGDVYAVVPLYRSPSGGDPIALGRTAVDRALALDPNLGEAHALRAHMHMIYDYDWTSAERELKLALALSPGSQRTLTFYSQLLIITNRVNEGVAAAEQARALDPLSADPTISLGGMLQIARRYDEALATLRRGTAMQPDNALGWATRLNAAVSSGHDDDVIESASGYLRTVNASVPTVGEMQSSLKSGGHAGLVHLMLDTFPPAELVRWRAQWYGELGQRDQALAALENAHKVRLPGLPFLMRYKQFDSMRGDPRFVSLAKQMGLEP